MGVSKNRGTPKSSILIGFSIINHPFSGTPIFGNTHMEIISSTIYIRIPVIKQSGFNGCSANDNDQSAEEKAKEYQG